ncbi:unnamed protein product [Protopolystoma xenopodis]|uniref:Uncharacterized protein n=1 Tax=Protopolystoma xenopodis TaxID=117903 RepID=A0A3S5A7K7_9PLAT|nr:unnamed protein product [Protopolystoma xenopodis]
MTLLLSDCDYPLRCAKLSSPSSTRLNPTMHRLQPSLPLDHVADLQRLLQPALRNALSNTSPNLSLAPIARRDDDGSDCHDTSNALHTDFEGDDDKGACHEAGAEVRLLNRYSSTDRREKTTLVESVEDPVGMSVDRKRGNGLLTCRACARPLLTTRFILTLRRPWNRQLHSSGSARGGLFEVMMPALHTSRLGKSDAGKTVANAKTETVGIARQMVLFCGTMERDRNIPSCQEEEDAVIMASRSQRTRSKGGRKRRAYMAEMKEKDRLRGVQSGGERGYGEKRPKTEADAAEWGKNWPDTKLRTGKRHKPDAQLQLSCQELKGNDDKLDAKASRECGFCRQPAISQTNRLKTVPFIVKAVEEVRARNSKEEVLHVEHFFEARHEREEMKKFGEHTEVRTSSLQEAGECDDKEEEEIEEEEEEEGEEGGEEVEDEDNVEESDNIDDEDEEGKKMGLSDEEGFSNTSLGRIPFTKDPIVLPDGIPNHDTTLFQNGNEDVAWGPDGAVNEANLSRVGTNHNLGSVNTPLVDVDFGACPAVGEMTKCSDLVDQTAQEEEVGFHPGCLTCANCRVQMDQPNQPCWYQKGGQGVVCSECRHR